MTQNQKIFLFIAENLSFNKAAKHFFVTQQCISDHINRIENEYGTKLFYRKPYLHLTQAGEAVYKSLSTINRIESDLKSSIENFSNEKRGSFTFGISTSRSKVLLPKVLNKYYEYFPEVNISFFSGDTSILENKLLKNEIDLFLGINSSLDLDLDITPVAEDYMYIVINKNLFKKYFSKEQLQLFKHGFDLNLLKDIPITMYYNTGALYQLMQQHILSHGIQLNKTPYFISECDVQISLCLNNTTCAIVPRMLSIHLLDNPEIFLFPIKDFNYPLRIDIVKNKYIDLPHYVKAFNNLLIEEIKNIQKLL
ncbi:MAG: LysR family transcriptional regulator [Peptoniphilus sp.]|uniref:LysR family transcriptional regulator n=1 Tax=Peptoniphilus sp. TaxID=1971214 RepID=UPI002A7583B1|nr:LysR family transcriptional regulator [Peptoniphilus sp.]MDY2987297.1 LysR family transcriptional regulator [Peptoniphilus sp.]